MAHKHSVKDDGDPRKYYAAIPNIVFKLGLNPYELSLYVYLKKVAGEEGMCWKSTSTIARELNMGAGTVSRTKGTLAISRTALNGKSLITIATEMQNGGNPNHAISITDIWPENMAELERVRLEKATRSQLEGDAFQRNETRSSGESARSTEEGTRSTHGDKEEPKKNNQEEVSMSLAQQAHRVFTFWREHLNHPKSILDPKRQRAIETRLRQGYTEHDLVLAVKGCKLTPYNMGDNREHRVYDDIELICRDAAHVDRFIAKAPTNGNGLPKKVETEEEKNRRETCPRCFGTGTERTDRGARSCSHGINQQHTERLEGVSAPS